MRFYTAPVTQIDGPSEPLNFIGDKITVTEQRFRELLIEALTAIGCTGDKFEEIKEILTDSVFRKGVQIMFTKFSISGKGEFKL